MAETVGGGECRGHGNVIQNANKVLREFCYCGNRNRFKISDLF